MEIVGARTGLRGHDSRHGLAQLGIVVLRGDLGFGYRIHWRIDDDDSENRILVVGAVQFEGCSAECLAVHLNLLRCLRVFIGGVRPAENLGARKQKLQVGEVLVADRKAGNLLLVENGGHVGLFSLQKRYGIGIDGNGGAGI